MVEQAIWAPSGTEKSALQPGTAAADPKKTAANAIRRWTVLILSLIIANKQKWRAAPATHPAAAAAPAGPPPGSHSVPGIGSHRVHEHDPPQPVS